MSRFFLAPDPLSLPFQGEFYCWVDSSEVAV